MAPEILSTFVEYAAIGGALGAASFLLLRVNARLYLETTAVWRPVALQLLRLALLGLILAVIAHAGAFPLLSALAGFLIARSIVLGRRGAMP